jgi:hypothetical protein
MAFFYSAHILKLPHDEFLKVFYDVTRKQKFSLNFSYKKEMILSMLLKLATLEPQ